MTDLAQQNCTLGVYYALGLCSCPQMLLLICRMPKERITYLSITMM